MKVLHRKHQVGLPYLFRPENPDARQYMIRVCREANTKPGSACAVNGGRINAKSNLTGKSGLRRRRFNRSEIFWPDQPGKSSRGPATTGLKTDMSSAKERMATRTNLLPRWPEASPQSSLAYPARMNQVEQPSASILSTRISAAAFTRHHRYLRIRHQRHRE